MQLKNPLANILHSKSSRLCEKISINKLTVGKLDTKEYYLRKLVIISEPLVYLLRATAINPRYRANLARFS